MRRSGSLLGRLRLQREGDRQVWWLQHDDSSKRLGFVVVTEQGEPQLADVRGNPLNHMEDPDGAKVVQLAPP